MQTIFVAVKCALGKAYEVADDLVQNVDEVSEVYSTSGQYDLLLKAYLDEGQDLGHFVNERIQTVTGVADTVTTIAFKAFT
jgi:DNA-binding Lrp family transcriptional regulator